MSQQYTQQPQATQGQPTHPQPGGYQAQTQTGQQLQQGPMAQQIGQQFQQSVSPDIQNAVMDLDRLETVCEWVKGRATERGRPRIAQRADDFAEVAHLEKNLLLRNSPFAEPIGQAVQQTVQQGVQELQQYAADPAAHEAITQARQTLGSIDAALSQFQQSTVQ